MGPSLGRRIAVTLLLPILLVAAAGWLTLPGVDRNAFDAMVTRSPFAGLYAGGSLHNVSVFALGVMPILTAYGLVELVAIVVPRWRRLRHVDPTGRAKLERASRFVALGLGAFQGFGVAKSLEALSASPFGGGDVLVTAGIRPTIMIIASLVAGLCVTFIVAEIVTRQGIANGLLAIMLVEELNAARSSVLRSVVERIRLQDLAPAALLGGLVVIAVAIVATWLAIRPEEGSAVTAKPAGERGYRDTARALAVRPWIPIPASALAPIPIATSLLMMPVTFALLFHAKDPWSSQDGSPTLWLAAKLVVTLSLALFFARLIHRPRDMADVATRLGVGSKSELETEAHAALRRALPATMLFLSTLLLAQAAGAVLPLAGIPIAVVPLATAVVMDAARSIRSLAASPDLVSVWAERRISVVPVLRAVLEGEGIAVRTRGESVLSLLQVFGPYAAVDILVREADAKRAAELLRHLLLGDEAPAREPLDAGASSAPSSPAPALSRRQRTIGLVVTFAIAAVSVGLTSIRMPSLARSLTTDATDIKVRPKLELAMVDDEGTDPFANVVEANVPRQIEIRIESAPVGIDSYGQRQLAKRQYAASKASSGESLGTVARRLEAYLATLPTPPGTRFALQATEDYDPDTGKATVDGYRSMLLFAKSELGTDDVEEAVASVNTQGGIEEVYVAITLSRKAADRFEELTAANVNRRLAILIDGKVTSAPVIRSKIGGGRVSITMGAGDFEKQRQEAQSLAKGLNGR